MIGLVGPKKGQVASGIPVLDHLIVGEGRRLSLKAAGFLGGPDA